jgi:dihydropteroate synthase
VAVLRLGDRTIEIGAQPILMGIVNVTPDSFSDGGEWFDCQRAVAHGEKLAAEGADWLDVGGESTRPGAKPVSLEDELQRVLPVVEALVRKTAAVVSIDTYKPQVAREAIAAGARIINDVTGFRDPQMIELAANSTAACAVMHMRGTPETMQNLAEYDDVTADLLIYFKDRMRGLAQAGVDPERVLLDPGIGFAKKRRHNLEILRRLSEIVGLGRPVLLGTSRKRIVGEVTGREPKDRLYGTLGSLVVGYMKGVRIFRVHDVGPARDALAIAAAVEFGE